MIPNGFADGNIELISPLSMVECCKRIDTSIEEKSIISIMTSMSCFFGERTGESFTVCTGAEISAVDRSLIFNGFLYKSPEGTLIKGNLHTAGYSIAQRFSSIASLLIGVVLLCLSGFFYSFFNKDEVILRLSGMFFVGSLVLIAMGIWNKKYAPNYLEQTKLMIKAFLQQTLQAHSLGKGM